MAIDFPTSPSVDQVHTAGGKSWRWNGASWVGITGAGATGATGPVGATGAPGVYLGYESKTAPAISAGVLTLNCGAGTVFVVSLNANITSLVFTSVPAAPSSYGFVLALVADGTARTVAWPASFKWPGGAAPTLTSTSGKTDLIVGTTWDGGTTWLVSLGGQSY
jgi:hypothetical protein